MGEEDKKERERVGGEKHISAIDLQCNGKKVI
jgi:hypothetical protein